MSSPTVSILIPAYSPRFFEESLASARSQTLADLEIVVTDDCPTDAIRDLVTPHAAEDDRIRYERNPSQLGARGNYLRGLELARGRLIKWLNDDDVLLPAAVERMAAVLDAHPDISVATAHRQPIDADGGLLGDLRWTVRPTLEDARLDGRSLIVEMVRPQLDLVGEPSSAMVRADDLARFEPDPFHLRGRRISGLVDVTTWTNLLLEGDAAYLVETLTLFRLHDGQLQWTPQSRANSLNAWRELDEAITALGLGGATGSVEGVPLGDRPWWPAAALAAAADAAAARARGDRAAAVAASERALVAAPGDPELALRLGRDLRADGRIREAVDALRAASVTGEGYAPALVELGDLLLGEGRADVAFDCFVRALELNPLDPQLREVVATLQRLAAAA